MSQIGTEIIRPSKTRIRNLPHPGVLLKVRMPELQAQILKPRITKIKHRTDKGWSSRSRNTVAHNSHSKSNLAGLVFLYICNFTVCRTFQITFAFGLPVSFTATVQWIKGFRNKFWKDFQIVKAKACWNSHQKITLKKLNVQQAELWSLRPLQESPRHFIQGHSSSFFRLAGCRPAKEVPGISSSQSTTGIVELEDITKQLEGGLPSLVSKYLCPGNSEQAPFMSSVYKQEDVSCHRAKSTSPTTTSTCVSSRYFFLHPLVIVYFEMISKWLKVVQQEVKLGFFISTILYKSAERFGSCL